MFSIRCFACAHAKAHCNFHAYGKGDTRGDHINHLVSRASLAHKKGKMKWESVANARIRLAQQMNVGSKDKAESNGEEGDGDDDHGGNDEDQEGGSIQGEGNRSKGMDEDDGDGEGTGDDGDDGSNGGRNTDKEVSSIQGEGDKSEGMDEEDSEGEGTGVEDVPMVSSSSPLLENPPPQFARRTIPFPRRRSSRSPEDVQDVQMAKEVAKDEVLFFPQSSSPVASSRSDSQPIRGPSRHPLPAPAHPTPSGSHYSVSRVPTPPVVSPSPLSLPPAAIGSSPFNFGTRIPSLVHSTPLFEQIGPEFRQKLESMRGKMDAMNKAIGTLAAKRKALEEDEKKLATEVHDTKELIDRMTTLMFS